MADHDFEREEGPGDRRVERRRDSGRGAAPDQRAKLPRAQAEQLAVQLEQPDLARAIRKRQALYRARRPYVEY